MGRILVNGAEALCLSCQSSAAMLTKDGEVRCNRCGRMMLVDKKTKELFIPEFGEDDMYQASIYTPELKSRRKNGRNFPIIKDRRRAKVYNHKRL